jgi:hypothetical protein
MYRSNLNSDFLISKIEEICKFVAQWTFRLPQEQKTRVRIPPGYKVFREYKATQALFVY